MEASERPVWRNTAWVTACATIGVALLVSALFGVDRPNDVWVPLGAVALVIAVVLLLTLRRVRQERREHETRLTEWAAERAAQEERLRIARELHDLASHGLGLITVRAGSARRGGSHEHAEALRDIERASREATVELRRMLTVLRSADPPCGDADPPRGDAAPLEPVDAAERLPRIIEEARGLGLDIEASLPGTAELAALSPSTRLTLCAIAREALMNAARHAGRTRARVRIGLRRGADIVEAGTVEAGTVEAGTVEAGTVEIDVEDRGISDRDVAAGWTPTPGAGVGLAGLRERVALLGGTIVAGPRGEGYAVTATLPLGEAL